jgi:hypothetical protein
MKSRRFSRSKLHPIPYELGLQSRISNGRKSVSGIGMNFATGPRSLQSVSQFGHERQNLRLAS